MKHAIVMENLELYIQYNIQRQKDRFPNKKIVCCCIIFFENFFNNIELKKKARANNHAVICCTLNKIFFSYNKQLGKNQKHLNYLIKIYN